MERHVLSIDIAARMLEMAEEYGLALAMNSVAWCGRTAS